MNIETPIKDNSIKKNKRESPFFALLSYFPIRFILACFGISIFVFSNLCPPFDRIEADIVILLLKAVNISAFYLSGNIHLGNTWTSFELAIPKNLQALFTVFYIALAITARTSLKIRAKILGFCALNGGIFIVTQFVGLSILYLTGSNPNTWFLHTDTLATAIISGFMIELMLFKILTLPSKTKVTPTIKRRYISEYLFFAATITISYLIFRFLLRFLQVEVDSTVGIYAAINVLLILNFTNYLGYIIWQIRIPKWIRLEKSQGFKKYNPPITFLLAAYNEEEFIERCIQSIDKAAGNYDGQTSIIVINDGSTDATASILSKIMPKLRHAKGRFITIPNSGKGNALNIGLKEVSDEIIFRIDSDSVIEQNSIPPVIRHFRDPDVGTVGGMILSIKEKSILQKIFNVSSLVFSSLKKTQDLYDIITIQSGAFSVFRKQALIQAGGWAENQFGEDGEITVRIGRLGYRNNFEDSACLWSDAPGSIIELRKQRARWALAFYQSRNRNISIITELRGPRSQYYAYNLLTHGLGFVNVLFWPFLFASILVNFPLHVNPHQLFSYLIRVPTPLIITEAIIFLIHYLGAFYFLSRFGKFRTHFPYVFLLRFYQIIILMMPRLEALNVILSWSSRYKQHTPSSFKELVKELGKSLAGYF